MIFFLIQFDFHTYCNIVVKTKGLYIMRNIFNIILKFDIKTTPLYRSNLTLYELLKKRS